MSDIPDFTKNYRKFMADLLKTHEEKDALSIAVGGNFEAIGLLEYYLLLQHGLEKNHTVIDVGCGSGRLAFSLRDYLDGLYIGIDVVPELLEYAKKMSNRPDWKFYAAPGLSLSEPDNSADFICFFSVFTHLTHEETYRYLLDSRRVLKPGGKIIFSFLEFFIPSHWDTFQNSLTNTDPEKVLNQFIGRDAIQAWATHLNLPIVEICDGNKPHININQVITWDTGWQMKEKGNLGQSVCVLTKE